MFKDKDIIGSLDITVNPPIKDIQGICNNDLLYIKACEEIASEILSLNPNNILIKKEILKIVKSKSSKYKLSKIPKYVDILKLLPEDNYLSKNC